MILSRLAAALVVGSGVLTAGTLFAVGDTPAANAVTPAAPRPAACHGSACEKAASDAAGCCVKAAACKSGVCPKRAARTKTAVRATKPSKATAVKSVKLKAPCGATAGGCSASACSRTAPTGTACSASVCSESACSIGACCPTEACREVCAEQQCCGTDACEAGCCEAGCCEAEESVPDFLSAAVTKARAATADFCGVCGTKVRDAIETVGCEMFADVCCESVCTEAGCSTVPCCGKTCCEESCCEERCGESACCEAPAVPGESATVFGLPTVAKVIDSAKLLGPVRFHLAYPGCCREEDWGSDGWRDFDRQSQTFSFSVGVKRDDVPCPTPSRASCPKETCCEPPVARVGFCELLSAVVTCGKNCACGEGCSCDPCGCGSCGVPDSVASLIRRVAACVPPAPIAAPARSPKIRTVSRTAATPAAANSAVPVGTWTRTLNDQSVSLTLTETGFSGRCTLAHTGCAVRFAGDCSVTSDGLLYGVITSAACESAGPSAGDAARRMEVEMVCRTLVDQPVSVRLRHGSDSMTVTDAKFAGIGIVGQPAPGDAAFLYMMLLTGEYAPGRPAPAKFVMDAAPVGPITR